MKTLLSILSVLGITLLAGLALGFPVMWLWNWLMPDIFNLCEIDFWQAVGLNVLGGLLFSKNSGGKGK